MNQANNINNPALVVIDLQNDYFPGGNFPLWNTDATLNSVEAAIAAAYAHGMPVVHVQHVANAANGPSPFFNAGTAGVQIHPRVLAAAPAAPVIVKQFADSFEGTNLHATLQALGVNELILCGMMTQNCVTHTALSRQADAYRKVTVLSDACTTVNEILHMIALHGMSPRVSLANSAEVFAA